MLFSTQQQWARLCSQECTIATIPAVNQAALCDGAGKTRSRRVLDHGFGCDLQAPPGHLGPGSQELGPFIAKGMSLRLC